MARTALKTIRGSLNPKLSQEDLARLADVTLATYRNAEAGRNITYTTATSIQRALNSVLSERGLEQVTLDQLELTIV